MGQQRDGTKVFSFMRQTKIFACSERFLTQEEDPKVREGREVEQVFPLNAKHKD